MNVKMARVNLNYSIRVVMRALVHFNARKFCVCICARVCAYAIDELRAMLQGVTRISTGGDTEK